MIKRHMKHRHMLLWHKIRTPTAGARRCQPTARSADQVFACFSVPQRKGRLIFHILSLCCQRICHRSWSKVVSCPSNSYLIVQIIIIGSVSTTAIQMIAIKHVGCDHDICLWPRGSVRFNREGEIYTEEMFLTRWRNRLAKKGQVLPWGMNKNILKQSCVQVFECRRKNK